MINYYKYLFIYFCCLFGLQSNAQIQSMVLDTRVDTASIVVKIEAGKLVLRPVSAHPTDSIVTIGEIRLEDADLLIFCKNALLYDKLSFSITAVLRNEQNNTILAFEQVYSKEVERDFVIVLKDVSEQGLYPNEMYLLEVRKTVYDEDNHFLDGTFVAPEFGWKQQRLPLGIAMVGVGAVAVSEWVYRPQLKEAESTYQRLWEDGAISGDEQYQQVLGWRKKHVTAQRVGYGVLGMSGFLWWWKSRKYCRAKKVYTVYAVAIHTDQVLLSPWVYTEEGRSGVGIQIRF